MSCSVLQPPNVSVLIKCKYLHVWHIIFKLVSKHIKMSTYLSTMMEYYLPISNDGATQSRIHSLPPYRFPRAIVAVILNTDRVIISVGFNDVPFACLISVYVSFISVRISSWRWSCLSLSFWVLISRFVSLYQTLPLVQNIPGILR